VNLVQWLKSADSDRERAFLWLIVCLRAGRLSVGEAVLRRVRDQGEPFWSALQAVCRDA